MEVLVVMSLLTLMFAFAMTRQGSETQRASSTGLADVVASELRAARGRAMSTGQPVAFCLPSGGGTLPHCQSFYLREGQSRGQLTRVRDLSSEFSDAYIAVVTWSAATRNRPVQDKAPFPVAGWLSPPTKDYCLIFNSDGTVWSNDLALQNGQYTLLICSGLNYQAASISGTTLTATPPNLFAATKASSPNVLTITPQGNIILKQGADSGLAVSATTLTVPYAGALPPLATSPSVGAPTIVDVNVQPAPLAPALNAQVQLGEYLSISVEAIDSAGAELFVEWESTRLTGLGSLEGAFSTSGRTPMIWDSGSDQWKADVIWAPPPDGVAGDTFDIKFQVSNENSASTLGTSALLTGVQLVTSRRILATTYGYPGTYFELLTPGGALTRLRDADMFSSGNKPRLSPDGTKLTWCENPLPADTNYIFTSNSDGSEARALTSYPVNFATLTGESVAWNHIGTRIYFNTDNRISMIRPDGTGLTNVINNVGKTSVLDVSADGKYIAWISGAGFSADLFIAQLNPNTGQLVAGSRRNLTLSEADPFTDPNSKKARLYSTDLTFDPDPPPGHQVLLYAGPPAGMFGLSNAMVIADFHEISQTAGLELLKDSFGNIVTFSSPAFSPSGAELASIGDFTNPGMFVWGWNDSVSPPVVTTAERVDSAPFGLAWATWR